MELRIKIGSVGYSEILEKKLNVEFKSFSIEEYKQMFQQLVESRYLLSNFDDIHWLVPDTILDYPIVLSFDMEVHNKLNLALKSYVVLRLISGISPGGIYTELLTLKRVIFETNAFKDIKALESLLVVQNNSYHNEAYKMASHVKDFLDFYNVENYTQIMGICNNIHNKGANSRELPKFQDVLIFDDIINDYFRKYPSDQTIKFLPIMMWWLLTNILPMRPSEFLLMQKDCLKVIDSYSSPFRISAPRIKNRSDSPGFVIRYDLIEIDRNTFNFLSQSIKKIESLGFKSDLLFPVELATNFKQLKFKKRKNKRMNIADLKYLIKSFYKEVIEEIYGIYNIEKIKPGDTRHFAIINMCLQGFNMLSIARMAGHENISSQLNYFSHAEHFAQSYVYRLAQRKFENKVSNNMGNGIIGWRRYIYDKGKTSSLNSEDIRKVQYGDCLEKTDIFPNSCIEYCEFCSNYRFNPSINDYDEAIKWLSDSSKYLEIKIKESIELMREISTNLANSFRQANNDLLKSTSTSLLSYMDMKATVDSRLMEADILEKTTK